MNATRFFYLLFLGIFLLSEVMTAEEKRKILIEYFYQPNCKECEMVSEFVLPQLKERFNNQYELRTYDTRVKDNFLKLAEYQDKLKLNENKSVYMILNRKYPLAGYDEIESELFKKTKECIKAKDAPESEEQTEENILLERRSRKMTLLAVITAGLIDGINPCVFSTLVFFVSLLSVSHIKGRKLIAVGALYCAACFLSYLALGLGVFHFLKFFSGYSTMRLIINWGMVLILGLFAILSFRDAWLFKRTGKAESVALQLPEGLKKSVHLVIKRGLSYKSLMIGSFIIGIIVTVFESVCTGQVYVPTLALLTKTSSGLSKWMFYLILYNIMFIIPLVLVFIAVYRGVSTHALIHWSKKNVIFSKILLGIFFIALAMLILFI